MSRNVQKASMELFAGITTAESLRRLVDAVVNESAKRRIAKGNPEGAYEADKTEDEVCAAVIEYWSEYEVGYSNSEF